MPTSSCSLKVPVEMSQDGPRAPISSSHLPPVHPSGLVHVVLPVGARIALPVLTVRKTTIKEGKRAGGSFPSWHRQWRVGVQ